jgi:hypothetical protein
MIRYGLHCDWKNHACRFPVRVVRGLRSPWYRALVVANSFAQDTFALFKPSRSQTVPPLLPAEDSNCTLLVPSISLRQRSMIGRKCVSLITGCWSLRQGPKKSQSAFLDAPDVCSKIILGPPALLIEIYKVSLMLRFHE